MKNYYSEMYQFAFNDPVCIMYGKFPWTLVPTQVQHVLQGTNPYAEEPSLIWIISFYCLIFLRRKHHAIFISHRKHELFVFYYWKIGPYLLYRAYLTGPFKVLRSCWVRVETMLRLHGDRSVTTEMRPLWNRDEIMPKCN